MVDTSSYQNQFKTLEEALKEAKEEKDDAKTLDKKIEKEIEKAERKIIGTEFKYKVYATAIRSAYEHVKKADRESIPLLWDLIETMERIPNLDIDLKQYILSSIALTAADAEETYEYRREKIIQNLRRYMKTIKNDKGLIKMNELYSLALEGKIPLRDFDEYLEKAREWDCGYNEEAQIRCARREVAFEYLKVFVEGLLIDPDKYEPLYKQLIETDNLGEFVKHLPKYI